MPILVGSRSPERARRRIARKRDGLLPVIQAGRPPADSWRPLTGSCALDAADNQDRPRFEGHMADCESYPWEVRGLTETAALLAAAAAISPPGGLGADRP
jgi:hypothetical protein